MGKSTPSGLRASVQAEKIGLSPQFFMPKSELLSFAACDCKYIPWSLYDSARKTFKENDFRLVIRLMADCRCQELIQLIEIVEDFDVAFAINLGSVYVDDRNDQVVECRVQPDV